MHIAIDLESVPPTVTLEDPDDFTSFRVLLRHPAETFVPRALVEELAGARAGEAGWRAGFEAMIVYAAEHGWINDAGAIRAHVEVAPAD